jgi:hypothetical protein
MPNIPNDWIAIVNGWVICHVTTRHGVLFIVRGTGRTYSTLQEAEAHAFTLRPGCPADRFIGRAGDVVPHGPWLRIEEVKFD